MEANIDNGTRHKRRRKKTTRGHKKHWAVWLTFGLVIGVLLCEVATTIGSVLFPGLGS